MRDITLQNIVDWLIPDFKKRDDDLKIKLLKRINEKREKKGTLKPSASKKEPPKQENSNTSTMSDCGESSQTGTGTGD